MTCKRVWDGRDADFPHQVTINRQHVMDKVIAQIEVADDLNGDFATVLTVTKRERKPRVPTFLGPMRKLGMHTIWFTDPHTAVAVRMRWG